MDIEFQQEVLHLLKRTSDLPPLARIVILLYASKDQTEVRSSSTAPEQGKTLTLP